MEDQARVWSLQTLSFSGSQTFLNHGPVNQHEFPGFQYPICTTVYSADSSIQISLFLSTSKR